LTRIGYVCYPLALCCVDNGCRGAWVGDRGAAGPGSAHPLLAGCRLQVTRLPSCPAASCPPDRQRKLPCHPGARQLVDRGQGSLSCGGKAACHWGTRTLASPGSPVSTGTHPGEPYARGQRARLHLPQKSMGPICPIHGSHRPPIRRVPSPHRQAVQLMGPIGIGSATLASCNPGI